MARAGRLAMLDRFTLRTTVRKLDELYQRLGGSRGYRRGAKWAHLIAASSFCTAVALRFYFLDAWLLPRWDAIRRRRLSRA
jgi:hypothetical protein